MGRALSRADAAGADRGPSARAGSAVGRKGNRSHATLMTKTPWALILGASSGFGEACSLELARTGMNIIGVHMDRRERLTHADDIQKRIRETGREAVFFNVNAADDDKRATTVEYIRNRLQADQPQGTVRVFLHSLAFGSLKPLAGSTDIASKK